MTPPSEIESPSEVQMHLTDPLDPAGGPKAETLDEAAIGFGRTLRIVSR